jgi:hypothetical protein
MGYWAGEERSPGGLDSGGLITILLADPELHSEGTGPCRNQGTEVLERKEVLRAQQGEHNRSSETMGTPQQQGKHFPWREERGSWWV